MIKLLACIFMTIDHIGLIFFPQQIILRLLGRLSMPLYAYCVARGIKNTHNLNAYIKRVFAVALGSQIPYMFMMQEMKLNICFLWVGAIVVIGAYESMESRFKRIFVTVGIIIASMFIPLDYGLYGLLYVVILYAFAFQNNDIKMYTAWLALHILKIMVDMQGGLLQLFTLPSIAIIDLCNYCRFEKSKKNREILTWFYPIHIIVLLTVYALNTYILSN